MGALDSSKVPAGVIAKVLAEPKRHKEMEEKLSSGVKDWSRGVWRGVSVRVDHWGRGRKAGAWGGGKGAGFSLLRSEGCRTSSEKCYQTGSGSKGYPGKKSEVGRLWRWERPSKQCGKERKNVRSSEIRVAESKTIWMPGQRHFQHLQQGGFTSGDLHCKPWQGRTQLPSQLVRGAKKKLEWVLPRFKGLFSTVMKKGGQIHHYLGLGL